ncbi:cytochrome P450 [Mycobacterium sp.]|uniref:cytochrome P450 n=1 Tax=Mycobacterium sp. TaxID=1785 RepID=UPI002DB25182|nr:cytochrome P450 [Mycobacterium sp.]
MTTPDTSTTRLPWDAEDPFPYYERRRRDGDVAWDDALGSWLILGYRPGQEILGGAGWTSDPLANPNVPSALRAFGRDSLRRNLLFTDGPNHTRLRGAVRDVFTRSFIVGLEEGVNAIASDIIDHIPSGVEFDFMSEIALPLPSSIAAAWLGLDVDSARLLDKELPAVSRMNLNFDDVDAVDAGMAAFAVLLTELLPLAANRRTHPGDDLLSFIAADPELELDDVVITALIIADAGRPTTANLLGSAMIRLLSPGVGGIRPVDEVDTAIDPLITELLRLDSPVQAVTRTATQDHHINDVTIRAGETAVVVLGAANRDPAVFNQPDELRLNRPGPAPLTFGYGAHFCLGAALARLEITTALRRVVARQPALCNQPIWQDTPAIRGPLTVPMTFA